VTCPAVSTHLRRGEAGVKNYFLLKDVLRTWENQSREIRKKLLLAHWRPPHYSASFSRQGRRVNLPALAWVQIRKKKRRPDRSSPPRPPVRHSHSDEKLIICVYAPPFSEVASITPITFCARSPYYCIVTPTAAILILMQLLLRAVVCPR
jgi:hypothetical protein